MDGNTFNKAVRLLEISLDAFNPDSPPQFNISERDKLKFNSGEEFAYIWNAKEKKWYYKARYTNPQDWTELS